MLLYNKLILFYCASARVHIIPLMTIQAKRGRPRTPTPGRYYGPPKRRGEDSPPSLFYQLHSFVPNQCYGHLPLLISLRTFFYLAESSSRRYIDRFDPRYDVPRYYDPRYERDPRSSRYDPRYDRYYDRPSYMDRSYDPRYDRGGAGYEGRGDRGYDRYDRDRRPPARYDPYSRRSPPY